MTVGQAALQSRDHPKGGDSWRCISRKLEVYLLSTPRSWGNESFPSRGRIGSTPLPVLHLPSFCSAELLLLFVTSCFVFCLLLEMPFAYYFLPLIWYFQVPFVTNVNCWLLWKPPLTLPDRVSWYFVCSMRMFPLFCGLAVLNSLFYYSIYHVAYLFTYLIIQVGHGQEKWWLWYNLEKEERRNLLDG